MANRVSTITTDWPDASREPAELVIDTYAEPHEAVGSSLMWRRPMKTADRHPEYKDTGPPHRRGHLRDRLPRTAEKGNQ